MSSKTPMTWEAVQHSASSLLSEGLFWLVSRPVRDSRSVDSTSAGNYLISLDGLHVYSGEAKNLSLRLKQQFDLRRTTFYKTYTMRTTKCQDIEAFKVQITDTSLGRKELEEFCIVNIPTALNKFHRSKQLRTAPAKTADLWLEIQQAGRDLVLQGENNMLQQHQTPWSSVAIPNSPGIYMVHYDDDNQPFYIGESSNLGERHIAHSKTTYFSALRRHIGTVMLGFKLQVRNGKKRYFDIDEETKIDALLRDCSVSFLTTYLGRLELEEYLIDKYNPVLNRKGNSAS